MCRILGSVSAAPISIGHELADAENPLIGQSQDHDSGWGAAWYPEARGEQPQLVRMPEAAFADAAFADLTVERARIFNVHVRRATIGGLSLENTHPFVSDRYALAHNGTVLNLGRLLEEGVRPTRGETDSELLFNVLMHRIDPSDVPGSLRELALDVVSGSRFSGLNLLLTDGFKLYAYRLGVFELHLLERPGQVLVASEPSSDEPWEAIGQDVLLTLDPEHVDRVERERLIGDVAMARADIVRFEEGQHLKGEARGAFAAERAAQLAAAE